jgi:hypothetical protein
VCVIFETARVFLVCLVFTRIGMPLAEIVFGSGEAYTVRKGS